MGLGLLRRLGRNFIVDCLKVRVFVRGSSCGVIFYHLGRDISVAVHGGDFTCCGLEEGLVWLRKKMESWFEIEVRAVLGGRSRAIRKLLFGEDCQVGLKRFGV